MKTLGLVMVMMVGVATEAVADAPKEKTAVAVRRTPLTPAKLNATPVRLDRYEKQARVVRFRTPGKQYASFSTDPHILEPGSMAVFEIRSVALTGSIARWRCVAVHDVAECLGSPVKLRYLPNDTKMVLTTTLKPREARPVGALALR